MGQQPDRNISRRRQHGLSDSVRCSFWRYSILLWRWTKKATWYACQSSSVPPLSWTHLVCLHSLHSQACFHPLLPLHVLLPDSCPRPGCSSVVPLSARGLLDVV